MDEIVNQTPLAKAAVDPEASLDRTELVEGDELRPPKVKGVRVETGYEDER